MIPFHDKKNLKKKEKKGGEVQKEESFWGCILRAFSNPFALCVCLLMCFLELFSGVWSFFWCCLFAILVMRGVVCCFLGCLVLLGGVGFGCDIFEIWGIFYFVFLDGYWVSSCILLLSFVESRAFINNYKKKNLFFQVIDHLL